MSCKSLSLLALLCVTCSTQEVGHFFHLSDVHLDLQYTPNTDPLWRCVKRSIPANDTAGAWGNEICDLPIRSYQAALQAMRTLNPNPDFIIYTGDSVPHWLDYWSVQQYTEDMVAAGVSTVISLLRANFPDTPIYPALGNHDNYLSDQLGQPPISASWLEFMANTWTPLLPADALETVAYGGYYTLLIRPKFRLIHFNSIYCDTENLYVALNQTTAHADQFVWFESVLSSARAAGERVYIIGHITPTDWFEFCTEPYLKLTTEYADIISAHFYGDRHSDEFRIVRSIQNTSQAVGMIYVMSSVVPETWFNPSFRQVHYYKTNGTLIDYDHYIAVLGDGRSPLKFVKEYSPKSAYNLRDLSPSSWLEAWKLMHTNNLLWTHFKTYMKTSYPWSCDSTCKANILAMIGMDPNSKSLWARPSRFISPPTHLLKDLGKLKIWHDTAMGKRDKEDLAVPCEVCMLVMDTVDFFLSSGASVHDVLLELEKLCPDLTMYWMERVCVGFIWLYGPWGLPVIAQEENPQRVCTALRICPS